MYKKYFKCLIILCCLLQVDLFSALITPIPLKVTDVNPKKVKLGHQLFFDPILSKNDKISCSNCHIISEGGDDNKKVSIGINGQKDNVNAPTVLNSRYNFVQFWNGRAKNLQEQAMDAITNSVEMGNTVSNLVKVLKNNSYYNKEFKSIYKNGVTKKNIADAIAEYEKTLITPNSPFDKYLRGDKNAITKEQKEGYELFKEIGCIACHNGVNIGGNLYAKFGNIMDANSSNLGRYDVTKNPNDKYLFKVPSLRNIALTAPYFHDGRFNNLKNAVEFMVKHQLGKNINKNDINKIVSFLKSLTGELPKNAQ